ncbi:MAG TPA: ABC transporter permease [Solirubrobacteraceae bacterium]|jgi:ribose transport system permease protein
MATATAPTRRSDAPQPQPLQKAGRALRAAPWAPVWLAIVVLWIASRWIVDPGFQTLDNVWAVVTAASFIAVAAAGQGLVILTGGIDLSIPWMMTLGGVMIAKWTGGSNSALIWALPALLGVGLGLGAINGAAVTFLGIAPVIVTIAMNSVAQGIVLLSTNGTPTGSSPPLLSDAMTKHVAGIPIIVIALVVFAAIVGLIMSRSTGGRRTYAVGNSERVARLSGVRVPAVIIGVYAISGLCSVLAGILLTASSSQGFLGMGDQYLLPSIAAVVIGGASILGGRGHYTGTFGGAIFLALLTSVLTAISVSDATRDILYGVVILLAVLAARERGLN